jgi:nucleoid-associated protein YgaU
MSSRLQTRADMPRSTFGALPAAHRRARARSRRRRLRGLVRLLVLVVVVAAVVFVGVRVAGASGPVSHYRVQTGDTLWSIAQRSYGEGRDLRPVVFAIERANHLEAADLQPGDDLLLPPVD